MQAVIGACEDHVFRGVERMVFKEARTKKSGIITDTFSNSYSFYKVSFIHGKSTVKGKYYGNVVKVGNALHIETSATFDF